MAVSTKSFQATFNVFSPRWGHESPYSVLMTPAKMQISTQATKLAIFEETEDGEPEWSGYDHRTGNPLMKILENDSIYPPSLVPMALEGAWEKWREGGASDDELREGLRALFDWIDQTAKNTPKSAVFQGVF